MEGLGRRRGKTGEHQLLWRLPESLQMMLQSATTLLPQDSSPQAEAMLWYFLHRVAAS